MFEDLAALFVLPAMGLGFASLYLWFMVRPTFAEEELAAVRTPWLRAALELGGVLKETTEEDGTTAAPPSIEAIVQGVPLTIEARAWREWGYARNAIEYDNRYQTVIMARSDLPRGLRLSLLVEERIDADPEAPFHERFRVVASFPDLAAAWLGGRFRGEAVKTRGWIFSIEGRRIVAVTERLEHDKGQLLAAARAVAALGRRGRDLLERWQAAAEQLGGAVSSEADTWTPCAGTRLALRAGDAEALVEVLVESVGKVDEPARLVTRVRSAVRDGQRLELALHGLRVPSFARYFPRVEELDPRLDSRYILRSSSPAEAARRFTPDLGRSIEDIAPIELTRDDRWVTLTLRGFVASSRVLDRATRVVVDIARPLGSGPYR